VRCAIVSDIHSNKYALRAVLDDIERHDVDLTINAGDTFGYYPWAREVYEMLRPLELSSVAGNHDHMILGLLVPAAGTSYWPAVEQNRATLGDSALDWLRGLPLEAGIPSQDLQLRLVHGTPDNPLEGRWYPDRNPANEGWLPSAGAVQVMGHTHYPMTTTLPSGGRMLNPGSVGQPRDGDPRPSWMLFDTATGRAQVFRTEYDIPAATLELQAMGWNERSIRALSKNVRGPLDSC
jgi:predicted phosphodiesterase